MLVIRAIRETHKQDLLALDRQRLISIRSRLDSLIKKCYAPFQFQPIFDSPKKFPALFLARIKND